MGIVATTAERLKEIMAERGLRQSDIIELAKPFMLIYDEQLTRPDISQYCSGKVAPSQGKIFLLANALNVSEAWLMGYDVPRERKSVLDAAFEKANDDTKRIVMYALKIKEIIDANS